MCEIRSTVDEALKKNREIGHAKANRGQPAYSIEDNVVLVAREEFSGGENYACAGADRRP